MNKKLSKLELFLKLGNYDSNRNSTDIVDVDLFEGEFSILKLGNGGSWCRKSNIRPYKLVVIKRNGKITYSWNPKDNEIQEIQKEIKEKCKISTGPQIKYIKIYGIDDNFSKSRPIRKQIRDFYKKIPCCICGSTSDLVCDHKNDLYNDPRVLDIKTQTFSDFQSLCTHCNLLKRQISKYTLQTKSRYPATKIPSMKVFGIDFVEGDSTLDLSNPNALKGTYRYDPIEFNKKVLEFIKNDNYLLRL